MARHYGTLNKADPKWLRTMAAHVPACFSADVWVMYLKGVQLEAQDAEGNPLRMRLARGETPNYCADCTRGHQRRMQAAGKCQPPAGATPPLEQRAAESAAP